MPTPYLLTGRIPDAAYAAGNNIKPKQTTASKPANNRFNNFQQRDKKSDDWYNSLLSNNN